MTNNKSNKGKKLQIIHSKLNFFKIFKVSIFCLFCLIFLSIYGVSITSAANINSTTYSITIPVKLQQSEILAICPNPYGNDSSEWVTIYAKTNCIFTDGEGKINLSGNNLYILTKNPGDFKREFKINFLINKSNTIGYKIVKFTKKLALSNSGESLWLYNNKKILDSVTYKRVPSGIILERTGRNSWDYFYQDWTFFKPINIKANYKIYITPAKFTFKGSNVIAASYTFTQQNIKSNKLELYLNAHPVGGIPKSEICIIRNLTKEKNDKIYFLNSKSYRFFHYKFAISGDNIVITTENWKWNKRGYIVTFKNEKVADYLRSILKHDSRYTINLNLDLNKICKYKEYKNNIEHNIEQGKSAEFYGNLTVFVLPDWNPILSSISKAKKRVYIEVPYMESDWIYYIKNNAEKSLNKPYDPLISSICEAAKNGASIKIILGNYKKNHIFINELRNELRKEVGRSNQNFSVKFLKMPLHGKLIITDKKAIICSANMDMYGLKRNREVGIIIYGKAVKWLTTSFISDWNTNLSKEGFTKNYPTSIDSIKVLIISSIILLISLILAYRLFTK